MLTVGTSLFFAINVRFRDTTFIVSMFFSVTILLLSSYLLSNSTTQQTTDACSVQPFVSILQLFQSSLAGPGMKLRLLQ